jgi:hypothetical protein
MNMLFFAYLLNLNGRLFCQGVFSRINDFEVFFDDPGIGPAAGKSFVLQKSSSLPGWDL